MKPTISFITPNYNNGDLVPRMLESTLSQDYPVHEVILIDDGSTDNSVEIIETWRRRYPQIKLLRNDRNRGIAQSVNRGLEIAEGELIVLRSADDVSYPGFLRKSVEMLNVHPAAGFCYADVGVFTNDPKEFSPRSQTWSDRPRFFQPQEFARAFCGSEFCGNSCVIRADAIRKAGGYIEELKWSCDWFMFMAIAFRHGICYLPEVLAGMRHDEKSYCNVGVRKDDEHRRVCLHMFDLLLGERYGDLLPLFNLSGCMGTFGPWLAELVLLEPHCWDARIAALTWRNFGMLNEAHAQRAGAIPGTIRAVLDRKRELIKRAHREKRGFSVAVYGAGTHTLALLNEWSTADLPAVSAVIVSQPSERKQFLGIPIVPLADVSPDRFDLIVISSRSFESEMVQACRRALPELPLLTFWNPELTSFGRPRG